MSGPGDDNHSAPDLDDGIEREDSANGGIGAPSAAWSQMALVGVGRASSMPADMPVDISEGIPASAPEGTDPAPSGMPAPAALGIGVGADSDAEPEADQGGVIPIVTVDDDPSSDDVREQAARATDADQPTGTIVAIAAGRGGAGKSLLAANIAVYLAQIGKRVVAVDADPAGGTLNHMLGTPRPGRGFGSFLRGRVETLEELAVDTPVAGVRLIAGETLAFGSPRSKMNSKAVLAAMRSISADTIVVDLGPPDSALGLDLWLGADVSILVTLADSASIEATYRFVKSAFLRLLRGERGLDKLQSQVGRPLPAALDLYRMALEFSRSAREDDAGVPAPEPAGTARPTGTLGAAKPLGKIPAVAGAVAQAMARFRPRFVVGQTRSLGDTKLGPQMAMAAHRRLGHSFDYLGHVEWDETVAAATRRHRPVMAEFPEAKVCRNIEKIVRRILSTEAERPSAAFLPPHLEAEQTFYEILETEPGVSDEEIRRAFRLCKEIYAVGSPVVAGLYDEAELLSLHDRANAAHDTLFAPERRRIYDLSLPEADLARAVRRAAEAPRADSTTVVRPDQTGPTPNPVEVGAEISGAVLRKLRESRGMELSEVAQRTKISERYLRSIEDERFDELPAPVYVRGFVTQIARILRIDPAKAAETYLRRFHGALGPGAGTPVLKEL